MSPSLSRFSVLFALAVPLAAQAKSPADVFPSRSYGFLEFAGLASCTESCDRLGLVQLAKGMLERGGKQLLEQESHKSEAEVREIVRDRLARAGIDREALRTVLQGRMAVGFGRPVFFGNAVMPSIALVVDVAGREEAANRMLERLAQELRQRARASEERREILGIEALVLHAARLDGAIASARLGGFQVVTNSVPFLEECIATYRGKSPALTSEQGYLRPRARLAQAPLLAAYASVRPLGEFLSWLVPYEATSFAHAVGVTGCDSLFAGIATVGKGSTDVLHLGATCPQDGMLRKVLSSRGPGQAAAWAADETGLFVSMAIDTKALVSELPRVIEALPAQVRRELERETRQGLPLQEIREMLENSGPEIAFAVSLPLKKGLIPDVTLLAQVADGARLERMILEHTQALGGGLTWKETEYQGTKIHYVNVQAGPVALSPAFAFKDGWLIASQQVLALKGVLARGRREGNVIAAAVAQDGAQDAAQSAAPLRAIARLNAAAQTYYDLALGSVPADAGFDPKLLPSKEELAEQLGDATAAIEIGADGITLRKTHPGGFGEIVAAIGGVLDWALAGGAKKGRVF